MRADQTPGTGLHRGDIQFTPHPPNPAPVVNKRRTSGHDAEKVVPFTGRKPGVPVVIDPYAGGHCNRFGFQVKVQRLGQAERVPFAGQFAMCDLAKGMNPRICTARSGNRWRIGFKPGQRRLDNRLDRGRGRLSLPARKRLSVVFDSERKTWHHLAIPPGEPKGNPSVKQGAEPRLRGSTASVMLHMICTSPGGYLHLHVLYLQRGTHFTRRGALSPRSLAGSPIPSIKSTPIRHIRQ